MHWKGSLLTQQASKQLYCCVVWAQIQHVQVQAVSSEIQLIFHTWQCYMIICRPVAGNVQGMHASHAV